MVGSAGRGAAVLVCDAISIGRNFSVVGHCVRGLDRGSMKHSPAREALSCTNLLSNRSAGLRRRVSTCSQQCEVKASRWSGGAQICWGRVQMAAVPRGNERLRWPACRTAALGDAIFTTISSKHHGLTHAFPTQIPLDRIRSVITTRRGQRGTRSRTSHTLLLNIISGRRHNHVQHRRSTTASPCIRYASAQASTRLRIASTGD